MRTPSSGALLAAHREIKRMDARLTELLTEIGHESALSSARAHLQLAVPEIARRLGEATAREAD